MTEIAVDRAESHPAVPPVRPRPPLRRRMLRFVARHRRTLGRLTLVLPALGVAGVDFALRGSRLLQLPGRYFFSYVVSLVESGVLWGVLLCVAAARRGVPRWIAATVFVLFATLSVGIQIYFHGQYSVYLNLQATLFGTSVTESVFGQVSADAANFLGSLLPVMAGGIALVWLGRKLVRPRRRLRQVTLALALPATVAVFFIPCSYASMQGSTPDVIYFHAIGGLVKQLSHGLDKASVRPGLRHPPELPPLHPTPARARNVLFVLTESVRADAACSSPVPECPGTPFTNRAVPERLGFEQVRANSTTTAIELAVLWAGVEPTDGREALHAAPVLFDFAAAAGIPSAYWTSHHMLFANSRLWVRDLPVRFHCGATHLDPQANIDLGAYDELLTARVKEELPQLGEPFVAVVQFGNTHVPYRADPSDAPFQPSLESKAPDDNDAYHNFYRNAVHFQDKTVADLVSFVRAAPFGPRTVILYTSDHGEQFREHEQLGHTQSLFDVEMRVPTWIDAPAGTLTDEERRVLASRRAEPIYHSDLAPTMLDWLGLWDAPEIAPYRAKMPGKSLVRPDPPERGAGPILHVSNCSGVWGCALENWGVVQGFRKLIAREWDADWGCYDVSEDPSEKASLPLERCADLLAEANRFYGGPPGQL